MNPKTIVVGGDFGEIPRQSRIIDEIWNPYRSYIDCINGGTMEDLKNIDLSSYNLILWMPNISNEEKKFYPKKPIGSVLIISKVLRNENSEKDAISRIFKMNANAVITIDKSKDEFVFKTIDALGNFWWETTNPETIIRYCNWIWKVYGLSKRIRSEKIENSENIPQPYYEDLDRFMELNRKVASKAESMGGRYFGNCSTRCNNLFPSTRVNGQILVSPRNLDKSGIFPHDMILVESNSSVVRYYGDRKPSIDTPVQIRIYQNAPEINYMIHGHYYIYGAPFTKSFYPCGDLREYDEIAEIIAKTYDNYAMGAINLRNHGFLLYSSTIDQMEQLFEKSIFVERRIGKEQVPLSEIAFR